MSSSLYRPVGRLLGNVPYDRDDVTGPNNTSFGTPQPAGTRFLADGEGYNARQWNRALASLGEQWDELAEKLLENNPCSGHVYYHQVAMGVPDVTDVLMPGWTFVGDYNGASPTTQAPEDLACVIDKRHFVSKAREGGASVHSSGAPVLVSDFRDGGITVSDGVPRVHVAATPITGATRYSITVGADLELTNHVIPGLWCKISGAVYGGYYKITQVRHSTVDLVNFRHRLRVSAIGGVWAVGNVVSTLSAPTITSVIVALDQPNGWVEVMMTETFPSAYSDDFSASLGVAGDISNVTLGETATLDSYDQPGDPVDFVPATIIGATAAVYTDGMTFYQPTAIVSPGLESNADHSIEYGFYHYVPNRFGATSLEQSQQTTSLHTSLLRALTTLEDEAGSYLDAALPSIHIGQGAITPELWNAPQVPPAAVPTLTYEGIEGLGMSGANPGRLMVDMAGVNPPDPTFQFDPLFGVGSIVTYPGAALIPGEEVELLVPPGVPIGYVYDAWVYTATIGGVPTTHNVVRVMVTDGSTRPAIGGTIVGLTSGAHGLVATDLSDQVPSPSIFTGGRMCRGWYAQEGDPKALLETTGPLANGTYAIYVEPVYNDEGVGGYLGRFYNGAGWYGRLAYVRVDTMTRGQRKALFEGYLVLEKFTISGGANLSKIVWTDIGNKQWPTGQRSFVDVELVPLPDSDPVQDISCANVPMGLVFGSSLGIDTVLGSNDATYGDGRRLFRRLGAFPLEIDDRSPWALTFSTNVEAHAFDASVGLKAILTVEPGGGDVKTILVYQISGAAFIVGDVVTGGSSGVSGVVTAVLDYDSVAGLLGLVITQKASLPADFEPGEDITAPGPKLGALLEVYRTGAVRTYGPGGGILAIEDEGSASIFYPLGGCSDGGTTQKRCVGFGSYYWTVTRLTLEYQTTDSDGGRFSKLDHITEVGGGREAFVVRVGTDYIDVVSTDDWAFPANPRIDNSPSAVVTEVAQAYVGHVLVLEVRGIWAYQNDNEKQYLNIIGSILPDGGRQEDGIAHIDGHDSTKKPSFEFPDVQLMTPKRVRRYLQLSDLCIDPTWVDVVARAPNPTAMIASRSMPTELAAGYNDLTVVISTLTLAGDNVDERAAFRVDLPVGVRIVDAGVKYHSEGLMAAMELMLYSRSVSIAGTNSLKRVVGHVFETGVPAVSWNELSGLDFSRWDTGATVTDWSNCFVLSLDADVVGAGARNGDVITGTAAGWAGVVLDSITGAPGSWVRVRLTAAPAYPLAGEAVTVTVNGGPGTTGANIAPGGVYDPPLPFDRAAAPPFILASNCEGAQVDAEHSYFLVPHPVNHGIGVMHAIIYELWVEYLVADLRC